MIQGKGPRRKLDRKRVNGRGSILLVTISATVLFLFFASAIYYYYRDSARLRIRETRLRSTSHTAHSLIALVAREMPHLAQVFVQEQKGEVPLSKVISYLRKKYKSKEMASFWRTFAGEGRLKIDLSHPHEIRIEVMLKHAGPPYRTSVLLDRFSYADHLFYFAKNIQLIALDGDLNFYGPVYVAGDLQLGAYGGNIKFATEGGSQFPVLYAEGEISRFSDIRSSYDIFLSRGTIHPRVSAPLASTARKRKWRKGQRDLAGVWYMDKSSGAIKRPFLEFDKLRRHAKQSATREFHYSLAKRGPFSMKRIVNPKLLQKHFVGRGTGARYFWNHIAGYRPQRVYISRLAKKVQKTKVHPIKDLCNSREVKHEIDEHTLQLAQKPVSVSLPDEAFSRFGKIKLGGKDWSRISRYTGLQELYINGKSKNYRIQGHKYYYDPVKKELRFLKDLYKKYYSILENAKPDGKTKDFAFQGRFPAYVYVNGKRKKVTKIRGRLIFDQPPPVGAKIGLLREKPDLYLKKQLPQRDLGVFVDPGIDALRVSLATLERLQRKMSPGEGHNNKYLFVFHEPIYLYGSTTSPLAILARKDVYLGDINTRAQSAPVTLVSGGVVWAYPGKSAQRVRHLWFYSQGDQLFSARHAPLPEGTNHLFEGTAVFAGTMTNAFVEKELTNSYLYSIEFFKNWNFVYDNSFDDNRPLFVPMYHKMKSVKW